MKQIPVGLLAILWWPIASQAAIGVAPQARKASLQIGYTMKTSCQDVGQDRATLSGPGGQRTRNGMEAAVWRLAQAAPQPGHQYSSAQGMFDGEMFAENVSTGGKFALGLLVGGVTGVIGTGIGYFLIGPAPMNPRANLAVQGKGQDYLLGFKTGWEKKTRSKKRNAFVGGGVIGWLVFLSILYA